ncbi:hypothetical protein [Shouchella miscanthi]|uniref:hypothetical protein n=1 Tax=Shouchella miscanthi TaxID=2598861 RepID=UPI0011A5325C|nr:hypothetical protein [Shouchella miscanthi]
MPYVTVLWLGEKALREISTFKHDEEEFQLSFNEHFSSAKKQLEEINDLLLSFHREEIDLKGLRIAVNEKREELDRLLFNFDDIGLPTKVNTVQTENLNELSDLIASINNVAVVCSNESYNDRALIQLISKYSQDASAAHDRIILE